MSAVDNLYLETANRWVKLTGTVNPNDDPDRDTAPIGTMYLMTGVDPVIPYIKNRTGENGWDEFILGRILGRTIYADASYDGEVENGSEANPFKTVQSAVDYAASLIPSWTDPVFIMLKGLFNSDTEVIIRNDNIHLYSDGYAEIKNTSDGNHYDLVYTNATLESWAAYKAGNYSNYSLLVNMGSTGPEYNTVTEVLMHRAGSFGVKGDATSDTTYFFWWGLCFYRTTTSNDFSIIARNTGAIYVTDCFNIGSYTFTNVGCGFYYNSFVSNSSNATYDTTDSNGYPDGLNHGEVRFRNCVVPGMTFSKSTHAYFLVCRSGAITLNNTSYLQCEGNLTIGNVTLNGTSYGVFRGSEITGNLTLASGNTGATALTLTEISGTITDPEGAITYNDKWMNSTLGGRCILLQNKSGGTLVKGTVVMQDSSNDNCIVSTGIGEYSIFGTVYMDILNNKWGWVVMSGPADVLVDNVGDTLRGYWIGASATTGGQATSQASLPTDSNHYKEIGHAMAARSGPGLIRCMIHLL
jgi:hypothetical protein